MPFQIDLDLSPGLTVPEVGRSPTGALYLALTRRQDHLVVNLTLPSLEALWFELTTRLAELRRS